MENTFLYDVFISFSFKDQTVADRIVNHLANLYGISCWICTEEIRAGEDFRSDIAQAIKASSLVVLVQSKKSVASVEVTKEIKYALKKGKMVKPFMIEDSQLADELDFEMPSAHYIDATRPELDDRIRELAKDICRTLGREFSAQDPAKASPATRETLLSTPSVIPRRVFCGRDGLLQQIHDSLSTERVVFLNGIGGIGKTQIAMQYAKRYAAQYDTIIYATYDGSLQKLISSDTVFALDPPMTPYTLADGSQESAEAFCQRKLAKIKSLVNARTLIIIDNFDVEEDPDLTEFLDGRYHILFTSRCDYSRYYSTVKVGAIESMEDLKQVFFRNYDGFDVDEDDPDVETLIELVNRHTYTIELLAQHMENSGQTPGEMIRALKEKGILSLNERVVSREMKTQIAYENLLKMFKLFSLSDQEQELLKYLSLMPKEGVSIREFKEWAGISSNSVLKGLERKSWIIKNSEGIALHPIICQVVCHEVAANEENCGPFLTRLLEQVTDARLWHCTKIEKDRYAAIFKSILRRFPVLNKATEALYFTAQALMSFAVDPNFSLELAKRLWEFCRQTYSETSYEAGYAAFKLGWLHAYNSQLPDAVNQACIWLGKASDIWSQVELETQKQKGALVQTITNLSKMHLVKYQKDADPRELDEAVALAKQSIACGLELLRKDDVQYAKVAGAQWQLADALCEGGRYREALENIDAAIALLVERFTENDSDTLYAMHRKAAILYAMGDISAAKVLAEKSAMGYVEFFGIAQPDVYKLYLLLGQCCEKLGEKAEAAEAFSAALKTGKLFFAPDSDAIRSLEARLQSSGTE